MNLTAIKRVTAIVIVGGVSVAVAAGLKVLGPPGEERARKLDVQRVSDLQQLASALDSYRTRHGHLPDSAETAAGEFNVVMVARDPDTNQPYGYRVLDSDRYELCADFQRASQPDRHSPAVGFWSHGPGRQCFTRNLRPPILQ
jgi:hypothetical protein